MKWILDKSVDINNISASDAIPEKEIILEYFKINSTPLAYASSTVFDSVINKSTDIPCILFSDGEYRWTSVLVYFFENYNIKLCDDFIQHILNQKNQK